MNEPIERGKRKDPMSFAGLRTFIFLLIVPLLTGCSRPHRTTGHVSLVAVGDVLFARGVGKQISEHGVEYPFELTQQITRKSDISFCNLECTLSNGGFCRRRRFKFRADPRLARTLRENGFTVASLANNHTLDYGRDAMMDTVNAVKEAGIVPVGAGVNRNDALRLKVVEKNGLNVGFIAYTDIPSYGVVRLDDRPTIAGINMDEITRQMEAAKSRCDVLVVSFHWGVEYMKIPTEHQQTLAHLCIDNGADLILGHHPHVLQPVEVYKGKPIVYSMGGFVWDSKLAGADKSAIYKFELGRSSAKLVQTIPIRSINCRPVIH